MKTMIIFASVIALLFTVPSAQSQTDSYQASYRTVIHEDTCFVDFYLRLMSGSSVKLGNLTLWLNYNPSALQYVGKIASFDGQWDSENTSCPGCYDDIFTQANSVNKRFSINVSQSIAATPTGGLQVPVSESRVGRVKFIVLDKMVEKQISWNELFLGLVDWNQNDITNRLSVAEEAVVPVELASFNKTSNEGLVEVSWTTYSETNNLGYYVYRSDMKPGEYQKITPNLISGAGSSERESNYSFVDNQVIIGKKYYYELADISYAGIVTRHGPIEIVVEPPKNYELSQNYPNPFNPSTTIKYKLKEAGMVKFEIYNLMGQQVKILVSKKMDAGVYSLEWDGRDNKSRLMPSGVYFYRLEVNNFVKTRRMQLLK